MSLGKKRREQEGHEERMIVREQENMRGGEEERLRGGLQRRIGGEGRKEERIGQFGGCLQRNKK